MKEFFKFSKETWSAIVITLLLMGTLKIGAIAGEYFSQKEQENEKLKTSTVTIDAER